MPTPESTAYIDYAGYTAGTVGAGFLAKAVPDVTPGSLTSYSTVASGRPIP
jgi:hypothetical protein